MTALALKRCRVTVADVNEPELYASMIVDTASIGLPDDMTVSLDAIHPALGILGALVVALDETIKSLPDEGQRPQ